VSLGDVVGKLFLPKKGEINVSTKTQLSALNHIWLTWRKRNEGEEETEREEQLTKAVIESFQQSFRATLAPPADEILSHVK
jgi:16S rRNA U1498 N3-methylase RsmE